MHAPETTRVFAAPRMVLLSLLALALVLLAAGCTDGQPAKEPRSVAPTPLAKLDAAKLRIARIDFCKLVEPAAVNDALGGPTGTVDSWGNGQRAPVGFGDAASDQVVQELGCSWTSGDSAARAWVFARPLDTAAAQQVVDSVRREPGCRTTPGGRFGAPSYAQACGAPGQPQRVRLGGLFGQSFLTCEVEGGVAVAELKKRADRWCVVVASDLNAA